MNFVVRLLVSAAVIFGVAYLFPSLIFVRDFTTALLAALILALVNAFIRPVVVLLTLPINVLTLGLFTLIINALMLYVVAWILGDGFRIQGFWQAIAAAFLISVVSTFLSSRLIRD